MKATRETSTDGARGSGRALLVIPIVIAMTIAGLGVAHLASRARAPKTIAEAPGESSGIAADTAVPGQSMTPPSPRSARSAPASESSAHRAPLLGTVRQVALGAVRGMEGLGLEGMANQLDPYLIGMTRALRAVDPGYLVSLRDEVASDMCGGAEKQDMDLMLVAKLMVADPTIASAQALNCAINRHPREDVVLWSLLDAWNDSGKEPLPALAAIEKGVQDERTRRRLVATPSATQAEQLALIAASRSATPIPHQSGLMTATGSANADNAKKE